MWGGYFDLRHVRQQNQDLEKTIDRLRLEQAALLEDARQGQRLQARAGLPGELHLFHAGGAGLGTSGSDQSRASISTRVRPTA